MYHDASGQRLTLYVTQEIPSQTKGTSAFQFGKDGPVMCFTGWIKTWAMPFQAAALNRIYCVLQKLFASKK
jgi:hypothetical protein